MAISEDEIQPVGPSTTGEDVRLEHLGYEQGMSAKLGQWNCVNVRRAQTVIWPPGYDRLQFQCCHIVSHSQGDIEPIVLTLSQDGRH